MEKVALQRKQGGREACAGTIHGRIDQQHRTTFCALEDRRSSYKPPFFVDSGFLVGASFEVLGGVDCALAEEYGWVRGIASYFNGSSSSTLGKGLEKVEEL